MMDLTSPAVVRDLIRRYGFSFTKSLGQNFIVSRKALDRMLDNAGISQDTGVLEIGPGIGTLTRELSSRAARVAAVEIDRALLPVLSETLADCENVQVYCEDALKLDLPTFCRDVLPCQRLAACANLPYYITTPTVTMLLESKLFSHITLLLQREAAQRLCALPGENDYCAASAIVRYYAEPKVLFRVSADCFFPRPKVASAVLSLAPVNRGLSREAEQMFFDVVRAAFAQRRKTLQNALTSAALCDRDRALACISSCGFREDVRGEMLGTEDFIRLSKELLN